MINMGQIIGDTQSVCPVCLKRINAKIIEMEDNIYLFKSCPEHGDFNIMIWRGKESFLAWQQKLTKDSGLSTWDNLSSFGCPYDCGICPEHEQDACCVLLELTNRCNQNCTYCFADADSIEAEKSFDEIKELLRYLLAHSMERPYNIQLSGGEPTLREDLPQIISFAKEMGFPYIQLNTNGQRLAKEKEYAVILKDSGLDSVFLQFDGTNDHIYQAIRGRSLLDVKNRAIENCREAGIGVVLVMTLVPGINVNNIGDTIEFMLERLPHIRGLHFQPVSYFGRHPGSKEVSPLHLTLAELVKEISLQSKGRMKERDFIPLGTGHPLCSFHGNFIFEEENSIEKIVAISDPQKGCCCSKPDIVKARDYILKKWGSYHNSNPSQIYEAASWDGFLQKITKKGFSISAMAFQDAWNIDLERLKRCRVYVADDINRLIPFCAYNLTSTSGEALYRKQKES